jgi:hypothetical protein
LTENGRIADAGFLPWRARSIVAPLGSCLMLEASRRSGIGAILVALACVCSSAAHAQWSPSATASFGHGLGAISLSQGNLSLGRNALRERAARQNGAALPARTPAQRNAEALTYTPDPQVSEKVRVSMIDLASATNPASRPQWEKAMAGDAILRDFDTLMTANGYSRLNFADNIAMLVTVCWEVANGRDATPAQIRGVRDQMRSVALATPEMRALPNAERQTLAETIAYQVLFMHVAKLSADRSGSQPQLAEVRDSAAKAARQYGVDVAHMTLTERGFRKL